MSEIIRNNWMEEDSSPGRCYLCSARDRTAPARFHLLYPQKNSDPVPLDWWECRSCNGWFVHPIPKPEIITRYWSSTDWADPNHELELAMAKTQVQRRILRDLSLRMRPGRLLDFGCNFGRFMMMAREAGWSPTGFEPNADAAARARSKGFQVYSGWSLEDAGFMEEDFAAITVIDVFCLVWDPIATLNVFQRLLKPGGVLAMRLTNKRFILGLVRSFSPPGPTRDVRVSKILLPQFHSIGLRPLRRILEEIGFDKIRVLPNATTAPWNALRLQTQVAYLGAAVLYYLSLKTINLSPGVLLFARKSLPEPQKS